jgi:CDP-diacylglycerol pyrophosphatase
MRYLRILGAAVLWVLPLAEADVRSCACDAERPETMESRECALCRAAEEQPAGTTYFVIRDANPNKPNRWLALPRYHGHNPQELAGMTPEQRTGYWTFAIAKAREFWGEEWGLAVNNLERRSQCHMHIHIGKLNEGVEDDRLVIVDGPADIPLPREGEGLWVHPVAGKLHVHFGNTSPELLLMH